MKKRTIVILSLAAMVSVSAGIIGADARTILRPGDHVIDVKRLADSVKITAQRLQEYENQLTKYENRLIQYATLPGLNEKVSDAVTALKTKLSGYSLVLNNTSLDDSVLRKRPTQDQLFTADQQRTYQRTLLNEVRQSNQEALNVAQTAAERAFDRDEAASAVASTDTDGVVGTRQKTAAITALSSLHDIEEIRMKAAAIINQIEADEAAYMQQDIEQEETKLGQFYPYDPYHPSDYDTDHAKQTENFGFLSTTNTGNS